MPISCCTARNRRKKRVRGNPPEPPTASRALEARLVDIIYFNETPKEHILNSFGCLFFMSTVCVAWFIVCICFGFASAARKNRMLFLLKFSSTFSKRSRWECKGRAAPYCLFCVLENFWEVYCKMFSIFSSSLGVNFELSRAFTFSII